MIKHLAATIISGLLYFALGLFLPWWCSFIAGLLVGILMYQSYLASFLTTFIGVCLISCGYIFTVSVLNDHILAKRIALLVLKQDSPELLIAVSGLISAFTAGTAAITGRSFMLFFKK
ncbi:MAG: hypothetical protein RLZZ172_1373 [Bacteroidota bacterium]|jgi:hypothetical protein